MFLELKQQLIIFLKYNPAASRLNLESDDRVNWDRGSNFGHLGATPLFPQPPQHSNVSAPFTSADPGGSSAALHSLQVTSSSGTPINYASAAATANNSSSSSSATTATPSGEYHHSVSHWTPATPDVHAWPSTFNGFDNYNGNYYHHHHQNFGHASSDVKSVAAPPVTPFTYGNPAAAAAVAYRSYNLAKVRDHGTSASFGFY